jgi:hypothetical protein
VTLSFTLTVCSNISHYIEVDYKSKIDFNYDYETVLASFGLVFGAVIAIPSIFFAFLICGGLKLNLINYGKFSLSIFFCLIIVTLISGYSYSNLFLVIGSVIASYPNDYFQMSVMGVASLMALIFLLLFLLTFIDNNECRGKVFLIFGFMLVQIGIYFAYYFKFY